MNKLKVLLTILMGTLIAFSAQRAYYVKTLYSRGLRWNPRNTPGR